MMNRRLSVAALVVLLMTPGVAALAGNDSGFSTGDWPFRPLVRPPLPAATSAGWASNPVDQFILSKLQERELAPNSAADKSTLLRRLSFDLTGLPPVPEEIEAFLADESPDAYERVVDRLLASPRFGERWARHWLDVVRFADTAGFKRDFLRPEAYRYRDYVIRAFNSDLPYDRFVVQQIAGDELEPGNPDALIATGLLRMYAQESTAADYVKLRQDILDDVTEVTGLAFLGLTLGCAKCHDHKFDPILQSDFFRLEASFAAMVPRDDLAPVTPDVLATNKRQQVEWEQATAEIRREIDELTAPVRNTAIRDTTLAYDTEAQRAWQTPEPQRTTLQQQLVAYSFRYVNNIVTKRIRRLEGDDKAKYDALQQRLSQFDALRPAPLPSAMAVSDGPGPAPATHVLVAGDYRKPDQAVSPGFPAFLGASKPRSDGIDQQPTLGGRRATLARWLTRPDHPLTSRVMVNRLWQHHFGRGIVASSNDFGSMGNTASHPELLDWLASELVAKGGSPKALHRLMVTSSIYRQSSQIDPNSQSQARAQKADPGNQLLWHAHRTRLEAEALRDALYAVSGRLDNTMFGPSVYFRLPDVVQANSADAWSPDPVAANLHRRSIYGYQARNLRFPLLAAFDQPDMYMSCGVRSETLTPTQALALMNGDVAAEQARHWAGRLLAEAPDDGRLVRRAWLEAYGRRPTQAELAGARQFLTVQSQRVYAHETEVPASSLPEPCPSCLEPHTAAAYVDLCHALLNSTEFLHLD